MQSCIRRALGTSRANAWLSFALAATSLSSCDIHERTLEVEARDGGGVSGRFSTQSSGNASGGTSPALHQGGTLGSNAMTESTIATGGGSDSTIPGNAGSGGAFVGSETGSAGVATSNPAAVGGTGGITTTSTTGGTTPSGGTSSTNGGGPAGAGSSARITAGGGGTGGTTATGGVATGGVATGGVATGGAATGGAATGGAATGGAPLCLIGSVPYLPNATNPASECQYCWPEGVVDNWMARAEGTACEKGTKVCHSGKCELGCFIGGKFYSENALEPGNCRSCQPTVSTTQWTKRPNRTGCATNQICYEGACKAGCYIDSKFYDAGTVNPNNPCQSCQIQSSLDNWSALTTLNGNACGTGKICHNGACEAACYIGTTFYAADENDTATPCGRCIPAKKIDGWSLRNDCFKSLALGTGHSCALVDTETIWCWGRNHLRQLGDTSGLDSTKPVKVVNSLGATAVAAGSTHTCAIRDQAVYCWGANSSGQIGNGVVSEFQNLPEKVRDLSLVAGVSAGASHTCAIDTAGAVQCWGDNQSGQLGFGSSDLSSARPVPVVGLDASSEDTKATSIAAGAVHNCALMLSGSVLCWGKNNAGQLGNGNNQDQRSPVEVKNLTDAVAIAAGYGHSCAVLANGGIRCWGSNGSGELGDGKVVSSNVPVQVGSNYVDNAVAVTAGQNFTCARLKTGALKCWGSDASDQLGNGGGDGNVQSTPVAVSNISTALKLSAGANHACAGLSGGGLQCWGDNTYGQLGDGSKILRSEPVDVLGFEF